MHVRSKLKDDIYDIALLAFCFCRRVVRRLSDAGRGENGRQAALAAERRQQAESQRVRDSGATDRHLVRCGLQPAGSDADGRVRRTAVLLQCQRQDGSGRRAAGCVRLRGNARRGAGQDAQPTVRLYAGAVHGTLLGDGIRRFLQHLDPLGTAGRCSQVDYPAARLYCIYRPGGHGRTIAQRSAGQGPGKSCSRAFRRHPVARIIRIPIGAPSLPRGDSVASQTIAGPLAANAYVRTGSSRRAAIARDDHPLADDDGSTTGTRCDRPCPGCRKGNLAAEPQPSDLGSLAAGGRGKRRRGD